MASYLIKWSKGEKRQEEEAEVVAVPQKRKMLCKTRFAARDQISRMVNMGYRSPEPVDENMSGNQFHCNNK